MQHARMTRHVLPAALVASLPSEPGSASTRIITHGAFEARWFAPRGVDRQPPPDRPEIFIVVRGRGTFVCNGEREPFAPGDLICKVNVETPVSLTDEQKELLRKFDESLGGDHHRPQEQSWMGRVKKFFDDMRA